MNTHQAVAHFGSKKKLADALDISPSAVTLWGNAIPLLRQFQIQMLTGGELKTDSFALPTVDKSSANSIKDASGLNGSVCVSSTSKATA